MQTHKTEWQIALKIKNKRNPNQSLFLVNKSKNGDEIMMQNPVFYLLYIFT